MYFKFKTLEEPMWSDDDYYDLFEGGYIKPEDLLEDLDQIAEVRQAMKIVTTFLNEAKETDTLIGV